MHSVLLRHQLFNIFSAQNVLFAESKDHLGNSFLTIINTLSKEAVLTEKQLSLPPAVFLKSVTSPKIYFAECRKPELPEVSFYHAFDFEGNFIETIEKEDFTKEYFLNKAIYEQESDYFSETVSLLSKNSLLIQSDIYYLENQNIAAVLFVENKNLTLQIVGKNFKKEYILKKNVRENSENIHFRLYEMFILVIWEEISEIFTFLVKDFFTLSEEKTL
jgi:hypothetical protein